MIWDVIAIAGYIGLAGFLWLILSEQVAEIRLNTKARNMTTAEHKILSWRKYQH